MFSMLAAGRDGFAAGAEDTGIRPLLLVAEQRDLLELGSSCGGGVLCKKHSTTLSLLGTSRTPFCHLLKSSAPH